MYHLCTLELYIHAKVDISLRAVSLLEHDLKAFAEQQRNACPSSVLNVFI
jgi:hypothetical protein